MARVILGFCGGGLASVLLSGIALAQVPGTLTPGAVGNEQRRTQQQFEFSLPAPQNAPQTDSVTGPAPAPHVLPATPPGGASFLLNGVTFDPSAFLSAAELDAAAKAYVGRQVSFADLNMLASSIDALYKTKGQITGHAVLAPQQLQNGVVHITLVEGRLASFAVVGASSTREDFIRDRIGVHPGDTVDVQRLSADVIYFNRTGDVQLRAVLRPGANFGETDLQLAVQEPASDSLDLFVDNQGVESTGVLEGGVSYRHNGLAHRNDRLSIYGVLSKGGITGSASYDIPVDIENTRVGVTYQRNTIKVVEGPYGSLDISGHGQSFGANVTRPLLAIEHWLITAIVNVAYSTSSTEEPAGAISDTRTYRGGTGVSFTYIGQSILAVFTPNISVARSHDNILHDNRDFVVASASFAARANLGAGFSARLLTSGQYANEKLLPGDFLFQIGGPASVRGYDSGTFAGDSGYYANFELHRDSGDLISGLDLFAFTDFGAVYSTSPSMRSLNSAGGGLSFTFGPHVQLTGSIAAPLRQATPNQSGYRAYFQLLFHF